METTLDILRFLQTYLGEHAWAPTYQEIAEGVNLAGKTSVIRHLDKLEAQGYIEREPYQSRCIRLTEKGLHFEF